MTKLITDVNNLDEVAQFIIKSAYHFPYNKELAEKHRAYWINILKDKQIIAYDRTYASSKVN
ncbi:MAG: hypothetical protein LBQ59_05225 [Candidatus Peribacteria bacterium]|jgi:hypothetical protein|nr:hypothetical protein [Candidatus Peribacteria bacterium]